MSIAIFSLGCSTDITDSNGKNKTKLNLDNMDSEFIITTTAKNLSDYFHVNHYIIDNSGNKLLDEGVNYKGTMTTTCKKSVMTSSYIEYSCITHRDTKSPVGDPDDEKQTIKLYDSSTYKVILKENSLSKDKVTEIGSITTK